MVDDYYEEMQYYDTLMICETIIGCHFLVWVYGVLYHVIDMLFPVF
jgi:hypothetical protein